MYPQKSTFNLKHINYKILTIIYFDKIEVIFGFKIKT